MPFALLLFGAKNYIILVKLIKFTKYNIMAVHSLKMFNTGQITLPKSWRERFKTKHFVAKETKKGLLIQPMLQDEDVIYYEDEGGCGLHFPKGVDPQILINMIEEIDGKD